MRANDKELSTVSAHVDLAVREHRRRLLRGAERLRPQLPARLDVERLQPRAVADLVHNGAITHRRGIAELRALDGPLRGLDVACLRAIYGRNHAHFVAVEVLIAVRHDHRAVFDYDARVDSAFRGHEAPNLLSGLRQDGVEGAVAKSRDEHSHAVDGRYEQRGIGRVVGTPARVGDVNDIPGPFVERDEAMGPVGVCSPIGDGCADNDQVSIDQRRHRPPAVRREGRVFFTERALPQKPAFLV